MDDSKTRGCDMPRGGADGDLRFRADPIPGIKPLGLVLDCDEVTFKLNELDIRLDPANAKRLLDGVDAIVIDGIRFAKAGSEKR